MSNFLQKGFPTDRWAITDPASLIANCVASLDAAIRTVFQITGSDGTTPKTTDFTAGTYPVNLQENLFRVLHDFQIGSGETVADIVDTIPVIPGLNEDRQLSTVEAIRVFLSGLAASWGDDIYIPVITTPVAGNFPVMTANGELATSSWDQDTWITRVVGAIPGNIPLMQASGLLQSSAWEPADFVAVAGDSMTGDLTMTGGAKVVGSTLLAAVYHWFDRMGLNVTDDTGATHAAIHLGIENADIGTPYFRSTAGAQFEIYHQGNLKDVLGLHSGATRASASTPVEAGTIPVTQPLDTTDWSQGDSLYSLVGGKVVVSEPGIYVVQVDVTSPNDDMIGVYVSDGVKTFVHHEPPVNGDLSTKCNPTFMMNLADNAAIELKVFHPAGAATPLAAALIVTKIGFDGDVS